MGTTPEHLKQVVGALNTNTWASADYAGNILKSTRGYQAGVPLADIAFIVTVSVTTRRIRQELAKSGLSETMVMEGVHQYFGLTQPENIPVEIDVSNVGIVDDEVFLVIADAVDLIRKLAKVAAVVHASYRMFGLSLNYLPSKTAAVVTWNGPNSKVEKLAAHVTKGVVFHCHDRPRTLPFTNSYKHMGTTAAPDNNISPEIAAKCATIVANTKNYTTHVLANTHVK